MHWAPWTSETRVLDDEARHGVDGAFVKLEDGYTHYQTIGPKDARTVVLIHGFSVPYFIWEPTFPALAQAGLHALRYDLFGRGYSDRPNVAYDLSLFVRQLRQLLETLGYLQVDVVGLSMGGPVATAFTTTHPETVRKVVLIDPSGARSIQLGFLYRLAVIPGISDLLFGLLGTEYMLDKAAADFFDPALVRVFQDRYRKQMEFRGFKRAILSTVRHGMLGNFADLYGALGEMGKPIMLVWGAEDRTVPFAQSRILEQLLRPEEVLVVPDCGHIPHYERPEVVHPRLIDFLKGTNA